MTFDQWWKRLTSETQSETLSCYDAYSLFAWAWKAAHEEGRKEGCREERRDIERTIRRGNRPISEFEDPRD